jgi:hypothetical protein
MSENATSTIGSRVAIWYLKKPNQPYLTFLKQFSRNKMILPFGFFGDLEEKSIFLGLFLLDFNKTYNITKFQNLFDIFLENFL